MCLTDLTHMRRNSLLLSFFLSKLNTLERSRLGGGLESCLTGISKTFPTKKDLPKNESWAPWELVDMKCVQMLVPLLNPEAADGGALPEGTNLASALGSSS